MDDFNQHQVKKLAGVQHYCDACDRTFYKTGMYPRCCPGLDAYVKRAVRRRMKLETRKALSDAVGEGRSDRGGELVD